MAEFEQELRTPEIARSSRVGTKANDFGRIFTPVTEKLMGAE